MAIQINKKWFDLFNDHILKKGYLSYFDDEIIENEIENDTISAIVVGQENYKVTINLDDQEIKEMTCTCRYAEKGNRCKHMVAVLFETDQAAISEFEKQDDLHTHLSLLQEHDLSNFQFFDDQEYIEDDIALKDNYQKDYSYQKDNGLNNEFIIDQLSQIVEALPEEMVKNHLIDQILSSKQQLEQFTYSLFGFINIEFDTSIIETYTSKITKLYEDYDITSSPTEDNQIAFLNNITNYIIKDIKPLYQQKEYSTLLKVASYCLYIISHATDDYFSIKQAEENLVNEVLQIWVVLYQLNDQQIIDELFKTIYYYQNYNPDAMIDYYIDQFLYDYFDQTYEYLLYKLERAHQKIAYLNDKKEAIGSNGLLTLWCERCFDLLIELEVDNETLDNFIHEHYNIREFRIFLIDRYIEFTDYYEALVVLKDSIELDKDYKDLISEYQKKIDDISKFMNN